MKTEEGIVLLAHGSQSSGVHVRKNIPSEIAGLLTSVLKAHELAWIKSELWRGTLAAIAYSRLRIPSVHGFRSVDAVSFEGTTFRGEPVPDIDFEMLHARLRRIAAAARELSLSSGKWFGHDYKREG